MKLRHDALPWLACRCAGAVLLLGVSAHAAIVNVQCSATDSDGAVRLNRAIHDSQAGDKIQIHGLCLLQDTVILRGDRTYEGDSRTGTVLREANGANLVALVASDSWNEDSPYTGSPIRIAHLTLDGNRAENAHTDVLVVRSWLTVLEDLLVQNAPHDGIQITNLSRHGTPLQSSQVNGHISNCFVTNSGGNGVHVVDTGNSVTDWSLLDSWIAYSGLSAINLDNAAGWTVRGNHVYGVMDDAIFASHCYATSIEQNYVEDFGDAPGERTHYGIACTMQGGSGSIISNNRVFMFAQEQAAARYVFIGVPVQNYGVGQLNVTGNLIVGAGGPADIGMAFQLNGGTGLNLASSGNSVQAVHTERVLGKGVTAVVPF